MPNWLVDGMNVVGSRPDGWWRDRRGAMRALAERLALFAETSGDSVAVVFDGRPSNTTATGSPVSSANAASRSARARMAP